MRTTTTIESLGRRYTLATDGRSWYVTTPRSFVQFNEHLRAMAFMLEIVSRHRDWAALEE